MERLFLKIAICFCFYILGAYATTDMLRLLKGGKDTEKEVSGRGCFCPVCGVRIYLYEQIPIFSYLLKRGHCTKCGSKIPAANFFLELGVFAYMTTICILAKFSIQSFFVCIIVYEALKVILVLHYGRRKDAFVKNLLKSLWLNVWIFLLIAFLFFLHGIV